MSDSNHPTSSKCNRRKPRLPRAITAVGVVLLVTSWIPIVLIARARVSNTQEPRYQFMLDMAKQPKYTTQSPSEVFADGRSMRPKVPGTVARGQLDEDDHYYRGFKIVKDPNTDREQTVFFEGLPSRIKLTEQFVHRGQDRFNIYCATCHGWDGSGNGPVANRSRELADGGSGAPINAASLHGGLVRDRSDGHIYNTITNGIRSMPGYAAQIPVEDRWAIVAYVRALELSHDPPTENRP